MYPSIPQEHWHLQAEDPMLLTRLLDLPFMVVTAVEYDAEHQRCVVFCEHMDGVACCSTCRQLSVHIHDYHTRTVRDCPWSERDCYVEFTARRFYCERCRCPFREDLEWLSRGKRLTERYRRFLFEECRASSIQAVSQKQRVGYKTLERLYYQLAQEQVAATQPAPVGALGIDEFATKKGHEYALALSDLEAGRVLAVLPDRKKETLQDYLSTWTEERRACVSEVAMDLWEPYAQAAAHSLPDARIVADRFHVMENLNEQVSLARRSIQRGLPEETRQTLKGCRWLLVRNQADLSAADKQKLEAMFCVSPQLRQLHALKEEFRTLFESDLTPEEAAPKLEAWMSAVESSGQRKLSKFVSTLKRRFEHVLNYFHHRLTSGAVEGLNNKIKLIKRSAYGFRNFEHFALRVLVECDGAT